MAFRAAIPAAAVFAGITALAVSAAGCAAAGHAAAPTRTAGCLKVQTLTFARAQNARALPASAVRCVPEAGLSSAMAAVAPRATQLTTASHGYPTVGKLTFKVGGVLSLNCTATVINGSAAARHSELIVTAAHCLEGTFGGARYTSSDLAFAPMWHDNRNPLGLWTVRKAYLNSAWLKCVAPPVGCRTNPLYDYAIIVLNPKHGKGIGDVTGSDGWKIGQPRTIRRVTIAGIPATSHNTLTRVATAVTVTKSGQRYRQAATRGFTDGSSGGPWLRQFSTSNGRGVLIGDTGGYQEGGPASGSPSYADVWTRDFAALVKAAAKYEG